MLGPANTVATNQMFVLERNDLQTWILLDYIDDFVVAVNQIQHDLLSSFRTKSSLFVDVDCYKLFDIKEVNAVCKSQVFCKPESEIKLSSGRHQDRS